MTDIPFEEGLDIPVPENDISKYVELYRQTSEHDTEVLWHKVRIIREAVADGADVPTLLAECGKESGDSRKQVAKFYAVAKVFRDNEIVQDMDYWTHEACATAPGVDLDDWQTYVIAHQWMTTAIRGYDSKQGKKNIRRKHTARTLRRAIRAANGNGQPKAKAETVFKGTTTFQGFDMDYSLILAVPFVAVENHLKDLTIGTPLQIVITRAPQPAAVEDAKEAVA